MKKIGLLLVSLLAAMMFCSCGDSDNYINGNGHSYREDRYTYYYRQDCSYDSYGYVCSNPVSLSSMLRIRISIEVDGYAKVFFDNFRYTYYADEYYYDYDERSGRNYYQFPMSDGDLFVYDDGSEAIFVDAIDDTEVHYLYTY